MAHTAQLLRLTALRQRHPEASEQELIAIWTEERYRDRLPADFLARACEAIRNYEPPGE